MIRRLARSTLFPYTTLFRSISKASFTMAASRLVEFLAVYPFGSFARRIRRGDRKSTRLNSSHEWISYAVFCLKKKKNLDDFTVNCQNYTTTPTAIEEIIVDI